MSGFFYQNTLALLLIIFVNFSIFYVVVDYEFINFDDHVYVYDNPNIQQGINYLSIKWAFTNYLAGNYHPFTVIAHMLNYELFAMDAGMHHLVNVVLHIFNAILIYFLFSKLIENKLYALYIAIIFSIHPMHLESVVWISELKDVLSTLWMLTALLLYIKFKESGKSLYVYLSLLAYLTALLSKPMAVIVPVLLVLIDLYMENKKKPIVYQFSIIYKTIKEKTIFVIIAFVFSIVTIRAQHEGGALVAYDVLDLYDRIVRVFYFYQEYLTRFLFPKGQSLFYAFKIDITSSDFGIAFLLIVSITIISFLIDRHEKNILFGWLWFILSMMPVIGLVHVGRQAMADRYTYISYVGLSVIFIVIVNGFFSRFENRKIFLNLFFIGFLSLLWMQSSNYIKSWESTNHVYLNMLEKNIPGYLKNRYSRPIQRPADMAQLEPDKDMLIINPIKLEYIRPAMQSIFAVFAQDLFDKGYFSESEYHYQFARYLAHNKQERITALYKIALIKYLQKEYFASLTYFKLIEKEIPGMFYLYQKTIYEIYTAILFEGVIK